MYLNIETINAREVEHNVEIVGNDDYKTYLFFNETKANEFYDVLNDSIDEYDDYETFVSFANNVYKEI